MFEHVYIGARRDRLCQVCGNQFASGERIFLGEATLGCIDAGFEVHQHAAQMGVEPQYCKDERSTAAAEVGNHLRSGKVPRASDRRVIFCRSRAHNGAKNRISFRILRPPGRYFGIADLRGRLASPNTVGQQGPAVGQQIRPENDGGPDRLRRILLQRSAEVSQPEVFGRRLFCHAHAGEGTQQAVQRTGICRTLFRQEANAAHLVSQRIGNAETCRRAQHAAPGICHGHFDEPRIRRDIADAAVWLGHTTPPIQWSHRGRALPLGLSLPHRRSVPNDAHLHPFVEHRFLLKNGST